MIPEGFSTQTTIACPLSLTETSANSPGFLMTEEATFGARFVACDSHMIVPCSCKERVKKRKKRKNRFCPVTRNTVKRPPIQTLFLTARQLRALHPAKRAPPGHQAERLQTASPGSRLPSG